MIAGDWKLEIQSEDALVLAPDLGSDILLLRIYANGLRCTRSCASPCRLILSPDPMRELDEARNMAEVLSVKMKFKCINTILDLITVVTADIT